MQEQRYEKKEHTMYKKPFAEKIRGCQSVPLQTISSILRSRNG